MKRNGFTLIELLAVIVILAIIAVIAVPIVLNIIDDAKENSNKRSIDMYAKAVENAVARYQLNVGKIPNNYEEVKDYIEYNGSEVVCEDFRIYSDGTTYLNQCSVDDKYINYSKGNAIGKGTLAEAILKQYGGISSISEIDQTWKEPEWSAEKDLSLGKSETVKFGTSYKLNENTGKFELLGDITEATVEECRNGTKKCGEYYEKGVLHKITSFTNNDKNDTSYSFYLKGMIKNAYNGFSSVVNGMYKMEDDLGMSYYYRGNTDNNYVKFGTYAAGSIVNNVTYEKETPIYWKIVRINGDGTIRLIYVGVELTESTGGYLESIGYAVGAWPFIDEWYEDNLKSKYNNYIAKGLFCYNYEELDLSEFEPYDWERLNYMAKNYSSTERINNQTPILKCSNEESKRISVINLINAEEVFVGAENFIVDESKEFSTMTPSVADNYAVESGSYNFREYVIFPSSWLEECGHSCPPAYEHAPVINLKADVKFKGDGSRKTPYEIIVE